MEEADAAIWKCKGEMVLQAGHVSQAARQQSCPMGSCKGGRLPSAFQAILHGPA